VCAPLGDDTGGVAHHPFVGGNVFRTFPPRSRVGLHHQDRLVPHFAVVARWQAEHQEQDPGSDLAREVRDEIEVVAILELGDRLVRDLAGGFDQRIQVALHERVLDQCAQAIVPRRVGRPEGRASPVRKLIHQVAVRGGERAPVGERGRDVGVP